MIVLAVALIALFGRPLVEEGPRRASANLQSLFSDDDYPVGALRSGVEGTVGFTVEVDSNGRVADCRITATSGSSELDTTTCALVRERARFRPALDDQGRPLPDTVHARITWRLEGQSPYLSIARDDVVVTLTWSDPDPVCTETWNSRAVGRMAARECLEMFGPAISAVRDASGAIELTFFGTVAPVGQIPDIDAGAHYGDLLWWQQAELEIAPTGEIQNCRMIQSVTDAAGSFPFLPRSEICAVYCSGGYRFEPAAEATGVRRLHVSNSLRLKRRDRSCVPP